MVETYNIYRNGNKIKSGLTETTFTDTGLTPNTEYEYQVSAENKVGESELTEPISITTDYSKPTKVMVAPATTSIDVGKTTTLSATVEPNTAQQGVNWLSDKDNIATVDANGKVMGKATGKATITATSKADGEIKGISTITVKSPVVSVTGVTIAPKTASLEIGATTQLNATVAPENATDKKVTWKSSDDTKATVANTGKVTAIGAGNATITATSTEDTSIKGTATVGVTEPDPPEGEV